ncbi:hypothetical protein [Myceligenerans pegani]|uniref:Integral membrane protein n=1 Tax=Myceligenerans pegani TaxID=2776917 RepID=A0ABR9N298_9MICO|nr:hypothetical protein [Myceligenerans sp. TRM 65318]MBE1877767.1 hypothetical protein [Myceligenerans sp. TRM 65318]MBE3020038.1 hypothetical protein [Myceligenerans sp. TRM 65318]
MSNDGGVPGQGGQNPQDPYGQQPGGQQNPYGPPGADGGQPQQPPSGSQPEPPQYGQPQYGQPQYGQYAPPGYQAQTPVPMGHSVPWAPPSIGESHRYAWQSFGRNAGVWIVMGLLLVVVGGVVFFVMNPWFGAAFAQFPELMESSDPAAITRWEEELTSASMEPGAIVFSVISSVILQVLGMTFYAAALASTRKQRIGFGDFFALRNWGGILLLALLMVLISNVVALIPLVGWLIQLVVGVLLVAAPYFVLAKDMNAIQAISSSVRLVTSNLGLVVLAYLIVLGYTFAGACLCLIGLLVVAPFSVIFGAHLFRRLQGEPIEAEQMAA